MSQTKTLKVRVTLFCILAGIVLATTAVVTDHWAVLSPHLEHHNTTCEAAHFGLWRICTKRIRMDDSKTCGPITLPGEQTSEQAQERDCGSTRPGASGPHLITPSLPRQAEWLCVLRLVGPIRLAGSFLDSRQERRLDRDPLPCLPQLGAQKTRKYPAVVETPSPSAEDDSSLGPLFSRGRK
ncbi:hypothetical protein P7K49_011676 [Saguinus oedipus]|uniref:Voltage-dependent calcium channel gamma-1 subunit n=1 Tax=Saguinus oedipus TaxID=9490 RepID=A0ABQ9VS35_SAGOE|nr:hypothetical protein P7K49_011676 [Saguinus oedipus]